MLFLFDELDIEKDILVKIYGFDYLIKVIIKIIVVGDE